MSTGDGLPPLREVVARHGLEPKRALGQNFLYDLNLTGRIARAAGPLEGVTVVEVGPGPGGLTRALLAGSSKQTLLHEGQLLLELGELQLQPRLGVFALEPRILLHPLLQSLVQPCILRLEQRGHLLRRLQVLHLLEAHPTFAVVLHGGPHRKFFLLEGRWRQLPPARQLAPFQEWD